MKLLKSENIFEDQKADRSCSDTSLEQHMYSNTHIPVHSFYTLPLTPSKEDQQCSAMFHRACTANEASPLTPASELKKASCLS